MAETATERAYRTIHERIVRLELAPGALLVESVVAEELGLGRTPVREALKMLACENLVVIVPQRGIYVAEITLTDLQEIAELRVELEALSARLAARRITRPELANLHTLVERLASVSPGDTETLMRIDGEFHTALGRAAGNRHLAGMLTSLYDKSLRLWRLALPRMGFLAAAVERHEGLLEALDAGDSEAAGRIMHEHVADFHAKIREAF